MATAPRTLRGEDYFKPLGIPLTVLEARHGDNVITSHAHTFIEVVFFAEGETIHEYAGKRYTLSPGDLFVIHPGEPHAYVHGKGVRIYNCLFMPEVLKPDMEYLCRMDGFFDLVMVEPFFRPETGLRVTLHLDAPTRLRVVELLTQIEREIRRKAPGYEALARATLIQLLVLVARFHAQANGARAVAEKEDLLGKRALIQQCIRYIEDHYPEEISLGSLADQAYLSPEYFSRIFKRLTSQTPIEFINTVRLDRARQLLATTEASITEIAFQTGFHDSNYFTRLFKKVVGQTPGEFRRRSAGG